MSNEIAEHTIKIQIKPLDISHQVVWTAGHKTTTAIANNRHWCVNVVGATVLCQTGDHVNLNCCVRKFIQDCEKCFDDGTSTLDACSSMQVNARLVDHVVKTKIRETKG